MSVSLSVCLGCGHRDWRISSVELTLAIWSHKLAGLIIARWPLKVGFTVGIDVAPRGRLGRL